MLTAGNTPSGSTPRSFLLAGVARRARLVDLALVGVLALGAFLRLFQIDATQFWKDSASTYALSHDMLTIGGFPVTGIPFSIGTFSPPTSVYIYMLPSLLGSPTLGAVETALATVAAIALTYYICRLYLSPAIGLMTALFFAISSGSVIYSRFIWPPNFITPVAVLLLAAILAGIAGRLRGWLAWAAPFLGVLIQMHPVTAGLVVLLILGWALAPETVRIRDVVIGVVAAIAVYLPLIIFEISSGFVDLRTYKHVATAKSVISAMVVHRFLDINSLIQAPGLADMSPYRALNIAWEALLLCGLLYLAWRVLAPILQGILGACAARNGAETTQTTGWRGRVAGLLGWMRAESQSRWRIDLILLLWPALILAVQIRHAAPIQIQYLLPTIPFQFLAAAILLYDLFGAARRLEATRRMLAASAGAVGVVLVAAVCVTQIIAIPATYLGPHPRSLQAQQAGLTRAQGLAERYHVAQVVFQLDYQTVEATNYMLETNYHFPAPTQIMSSGDCLPRAPAGGARVLYLMTGTESSWERFLTRIPGVHDLMGVLSEGDYYRAYVVTPDQITAQLRPFGALSLKTPITFGATVVADQIWQAPQPDQPAALAIETHLAQTQATLPFHLRYGLTATLASSASQPVAAGNMYCTVAPWIPGQKVYYMIPAITSADAGQGDTLTLSAGSRVYASGDRLRIGPLRLISAYDLTSVEYITAPTTSQTFAVEGCGQPVMCAGATSATIRASG